MKKAKKIKTYFYGFHIKSRSLLMIGKVVVVPCLKISNTVQNMKLLLGQPTLILIAPPSRGETRQSSVSLWYFFLNYYVLVYIFLSSPGGPLINNASVEKSVAKENS